MKDLQPEYLVDGIRIVAEGESLLAPPVTTRLIEAVNQHRPRLSPPSSIRSLTSRELEIFTLIATGLSNSEIAEQLVVAGATVKTHINRILTNSACATESKLSSSPTKPESSTQEAANKDTRHPPS